MEGDDYEARQTSKMQTKAKDLCWKVLDRAQSLVLRSYTVHKLRSYTVHKLR